MKAIPVAYRPVGEFPIESAEAQRFRTSFGPPSAALVDSIAHQGVLDPIIVQGSPEHGQVVCGFRRIAAAAQAGLTEIPVRFVEADDSRCLHMALEHNLAQGPVRLVEAARAVDRWRRLLAWSEDRLRQELLPLVGLAPTRRTLEQLDVILTLPAAAQEALWVGRLDISHVDLLARFPASDRPEVCRFVLESVRLTHSEMLEVLRHLSDICRREGLSTGRLLAEVPEASRHPAAALRDWLARRRRPMLAAQQERLKTLIEQLALPPAVRVHADPTFERTDLEVTLRLTAPADWPRLVDALARAGRPERLQALFDCLHSNDVPLKD